MVNTALSGFIAYNPPKGACIKLINFSDAPLLIISKKGLKMYDGFYIDVFMTVIFIFILFKMRKNRT